MVNLIGQHWLSVKNVAGHFQVACRTVRQWLEHGTGGNRNIRLQGTKVGRAWRITQADLRRFEEELSQ